MFMLQESTDGFDITNLTVFDAAQCVAKLR
jgi:hypothetical protein